MVVVSVKSPLHKQLTIPALRAQKDVLVEWPFGSDLKEAQEIAGLARKQGVRSFVGLQSRRLPTLCEVLEL